MDTIRGQSSSDQGSIEAMALSPDNRFLAVGVRMPDSPIRLYDFPRRKLIGVLRGHGHTVFSLAFSDDSRFLVSGSADKTIKLWSVAERRLVRTFTGHTDAVYGVALHGRRMVSGSWDGTVRLWDIEQRAALKTSREVGDRVFDVAFAPDGSHIAAIGKDNEKLLLFDGDLNPQQTIANGTGARHLCFSPDGRKLLLGRRAGGSAPACHVYERTGDRWQLAGSQDGQPGYVEGVAFLDDATAVTAGGDAHTIALWKWDGGKAHIVRALAGQGRPIGAVGIAGNVLAYSDILAAPHQSVPLTKAFDLAAPGLKTLENGARFTGPQTQNGPYRLQHAAGGAYGYGDAVLNIQKDGQTVASITRTAYDAYSHTAYTFTPDRTIISGGRAGKLIAYDVRGRVLAEFRGHDDDITALAVSADGKRLVSASRDQTIKLWNLEEVGQKRWIDPVVTLFIGADNEWVMWTAGGYYTASPNGAKYIGWQKNGSDTEDALFYSADQLFAEYYRPEIVQAAVQSGAPAEQVVADLGVRAAPPIEKSLEGVPEVKIIWDSGSPDDDAVQVTVEARDTGGGVQEIGLFRNGKRVSNAQTGDKGFIRVAPGEKTALTYMVTLEPGENELKAVAFNAARTQSAPATLTIRHKATRPTANLYLVTVGINDYKNDTYHLSWARSDAEAFAAAVEKSGGGIFQRVIPLALADGEAVRANLETALRRIAEGDAASNIPKARPEDVFVFYYAGHGTMSEGEPNKPPDFYLVLSDIVRMTDDDQLAKQGIAASELVDWCSRIDAGKQLVVLDACQSGGAVQRFARRGAAQEKAIAQLARSAGLAVFASAGTEQYASEVGDLGHGLFTYALLEGLSGKAEIGDPGDGKITINELMAYLNDTVPKLTERFRRKEQYPDVYFRGNDFPLGVR